MVERFTGRDMKWRYVDDNRVGDHICYYRDLRKAKAHYPAWDITKNLDSILGEITSGWAERLASPKLS